MPANDDDSRLPFTLPTIRGKKVTAAFDGGTVSSDGGVLLLAGADKRLGLIDALARLFPDTRDPAQVTHSVADMLRERIFAIACGYPDCNDLDTLRADPAFKMACGRYVAELSREQSSITDQARKQLREREQDAKNQFARKQKQRDIDRSR
jgi:hypothetical protein